jgi:multiple sugar transport system permease protein
MIRVTTTPSGPLYKKWYLPYAFVAPAILLIAFFAFLPIIWGLLLSLQPDHLAQRGRFVVREVTGENYRRAFADPILWKSIRVTLTYNVSSTLLVVVVAVLSAMALTHVGRSAAFFQSLLFVPICVAQPVVVIIFRAMLDPHSGIANGILAALRLPLQGFYESQSQALWVLVYLAVWTGTGFWTLVFSSALRNIPNEIFEASIIDGAGALRRFLAITIPLLRRILLLACVVLSIQHFVVFVPAQLLTKGGPNDTTRFLMYEAAQRVMRFAHPGHANAVVMVILVMMFIVVGIQFGLLRSEND